MSEGLWRLITGFFRFLSALLRAGEMFGTIPDVFGMIGDFFKGLRRKLFRRFNDPAENKKNPGDGF